MKLRWLWLCQAWRRRVNKGWTKVNSLAWQPMCRSHTHCSASQQTEQQCSLPGSGVERWSETQRVICRPPARATQPGLWAHADIESALWTNNLILTFCVGIILSIFLLIGPTFDIFFSNLFYQGNNQFLLQSFYFITIFFRKILIPLIIILC